MTDALTCLLLLFADTYKPFSENMLWEYLFLSSFQTDLMSIIMVFHQSKFCVKSYKPNYFCMIFYLSKCKSSIFIMSSKEEHVQFLISFF